MNTIQIQGNVVMFMHPVKRADLSYSGNRLILTYNPDMGFCQSMAVTGDVESILVELVGKQSAEHMLLAAKLNKGK